MVVIQRSRKQKKKGSRRGAESRDKEGPFTKNRVVSKKVSFCWRVAIVCLACSSIAIPFTHAQEPDFDIVTITLEGAVSGIVTKDVNGDARNDILAAHIEGDGVGAGRYVSVFLQSSDGGFSTRASGRFRVNDNVLALAVGDVARDGQADSTPSPNARANEIIFLTHDGISYCSFADVMASSRAHPLLNAPIFFDFPSGDLLPVWNNILDLNGDGYDDIIVPQPNNYLVLFQDKNRGWAKGQEINIPAKREIIEPLFGDERYFLSVESTIAQVLPGDFNANGRKDLFALDGEKLMVFLQKVLRQGDGSSEAASHFDKEPTYATPLSALKVRASENMLGGTSITVRDVNGDHRADMIITRTKGKVGVFESIRTSHLLYLNTGEGFFNTIPTQIINTKGASIRPRFFDFDDDGDQDMLVSAFRTDLISTVKAAILKSFRISYFLYLLEGDGRYSRKPLFQRDVSISMKLIEGNGTIPVAYFEGDFDGDGQRDLLTAASDDKLKVYRGKIGTGFFDKGKIIFESKPMFEFAVKPSLLLKIEDINSDGISDIGMFYPSTEEFDNRICLIVSRKGVNK